MMVIALVIAVITVVLARVMRGMVVTVTVVNVRRAAREHERAREECGGRAGAE